MAAPTFLGLMCIYRRRRGSRRWPTGRGGSHPRVPPRLRQQAAGALWVASEAALQSSGVLFRIKKFRKFSSNSENISRTDFLKYKNSKNRELALGILSIG